MRLECQLSNLPNTSAALYFLCPGANAKLNWRPREESIHGKHGG